MGKIFAIIVFFLVIVLICGAIGSFAWPYTINTWAEYMEWDKSPNYNRVTGKTGFLLGICPIVGQITVAGAIITGVCDIIFIPDN